MSEQECSNPNGYHKITLNVDHDTFHRWKRALGYYTGSDIDVCTALGLMLDDAKSGARSRAESREFDLIMTTFPGAKVKA